MTKALLTVSSSAVLFHERYTQLEGVAVNAAGALVSITPFLYRVPLGREVVIVVLHCIHHAVKRTRLDRQTLRLTDSRLPCGQDALGLFELPWSPKVGRLGYKVQVAGT
jgi:hypothetical protein